MSVKKAIKKALIKTPVPKTISSLETRLEENLKKCFASLLSGPDKWIQKNKNAYLGKRCFVIATGPSLNQIDLSKIKNEYTIGVNGIYKIADEINLDFFIYVSDWYWKHHKEGIQNITCQRRFLPSDLKDHLQSKAETSWINVIRPSYYNWFFKEKKVPYDFSMFPNKYFYAGGTVLFLALQLAYYLGFHDVVLLGVDHSYRKDDNKEKKHGGYQYDTSKGDQAHFDKDYNPKDIQYHVDLDAMENGYQMAKDVFEKDGRRIVNASPGSMLDVYDKVSYNELF